MRAGAGFNATVVERGGGGGGGGHSGWHSPVPYLFGGLAAMLGLIAFALLFLACSYWKLSGYLDGSRRDGGDASSGPEPDCKMSTATVAPAACYEEKIVVIMAGDEKPTYLATPISSRALSFGYHSTKDDQYNEGEKKDNEEEEENVKDTTNEEHEQGQSENPSLDV